MRNEFIPPRQFAKKKSGLSIAKPQLNQKEAAHGVASTEDGKGNTTGRVVFPNSEHSMEPVRNQVGFVASFLHKGAESAIPTRQLVELTGCASARQLQTLISQEREHGVVILSRPNGGYYLPADGLKGREEMRAFVSTINARAINTLRAAASAKAALSVLDGQQHIEEAG